MSYTSLKWRCYHVHDIVIIGCTATCHIAIDANFVIMTSLPFHNTVITIYTNTDHINLPENESNHTDRFVMIGCIGGWSYRPTHTCRHWLQWRHHEYFFISLVYNLMFSCSRGVRTSMNEAHIIKHSLIHWYESVIFAEFSSFAASDVLV